jgi:hypothetical protein
MLTAEFVAEVFEGHHRILKVGTHKDGCFAVDASGMGMSAVKESEKKRTRKR